MEQEIIAKSRETARTFSALRHRNYQLYFGGQLVSVIGTWMQVIAQAWVVYQISHSELLLGVVSFASAVPALIISPFGGVVVDTVPKRRLLVATQAGLMLLAFATAALSFTKLLEVWHLVVLAVLMGVINSFDAPARQAFVVEMVGREDLPNAVALNSMMFNGARVIGPALGGLLLAAVGSSWCFFLNGVSFLAVIAGLLAMRVADVAQRSNVANPVVLFREGIGYAARHRTIIGLLLLTVTLTVFGSAYQTLLPAFIDRELKAGAAAYGVINGAIGVGAVLGSLLVARTGNRGQRGMYLSRAILIYPLVLAVFAFTSTYVGALALAFALGFGFLVVSTNINSLLQLNVSDEMRGRVLSLYTLVFFGISPFGNLLAGSLAQAWTNSATIALTAAVTLLGAAVILWFVPEIRKMK